MLAASRSESDMETIMQLLKVGNVNAKASQVPERAAAGSLPKASPFDQLGVLRSGNFSTLGGGGGTRFRFCPTTTHTRFDPLPWILL